MVFDDLLLQLLSIAKETWFLWFPLGTVLLFLDTWTSYIHRLFRESVEYVYLEVRIPREIRRGPKAMEQFFAAIHSAINSSQPGDFMALYWNGEITLAYSFEIVSFGGEVHFFIRTPKQYKNIVEANLYAYYPDIEILTVSDYTDRLPNKLSKLYTAGYDIWGSVLILDKEDVYPIRTHVEFETPDEFNQFDPIAGLVEMLSKFKPGEELWLQFIMAPAPGSWKDKGRRLISKLQQEGRQQSSIGDGKITTVDRTPGQTDTIKAIERNISKPGFQTRIRYIYMAPTTIYDTDIAKSGIPSVFNQYKLESQNSFKHDVNIRTSTLWYKYPYFFPAWRLKRRKETILGEYSKRSIHSTSVLTLITSKVTIDPNVPILNTEEMATIYHYPTAMVLTAPSIQRMESKKVGVPAGLPIFDDEKIPEGFKLK